MQHISQTILKENNEVVNLILQKPIIFVLSGILWKVHNSRKASLNYSWFQYWPPQNGDLYSLESFQTIQSVTLLCHDTFYHVTGHSESYALCKHSQVPLKIPRRLVWYVWAPPQTDT